MMPSAIFSRHQWSDVMMTFVSSHRLALFIAVGIFDSIRSANSRFPKYPLSGGIGFANSSFSASKTKAS